MPRTMRQIFADVKRELALAMTDSAWEMYIQPLEPKSFEQGVLVLEATSPFAIEWCQVRLDKVIRRELQAHSGRPIETRYQVRKETETNGSGKGDGVLPVRRVDDPARDQQARTEKSDGHVAGVSHWRGPRSGNSSAGVHGQGEAEAAGIGGGEA